jgi:hypothetical protein
MKRTKIVKFIVNNHTIEEIDGDDVTHECVEKIKSSLSVIHNVPFDDIEVDFEDAIKPEVSKTLFVTDKGLQFRADNPYASLRSVDTPLPAFDITADEDFEKFLGLLVKGDIDNAIIFR